MDIVYNSNMHVDLIYNVRDMLTFYVHFNLSLRLRAATDNSHSIRQTSPHCSLQRLLLILLSSLLPWSFHFCPSSLSPCGLNGSLSLWMFASLWLSSAGYWVTQAPIEKHPTMTIILCSDGSNLCLGTKKEHLWKTLLPLKWRAQWRQKANGLNFVFLQFFLELNSLNFKLSEHAVTSWR